MPKKKWIQVSHHHANYVAYGHIGRRFAKYLEDLGLNTYHRFVDGHDFTHKTTDRLLEGKVSSFHHLPDLCDSEILFSFPKSEAIWNGIRFRKKDRILYTMWESTRLRSKYVKRIVENFKCVIVPTNYSRECLLRSGVTIPIYLSPLGIDTGFFKPNEKFPDNRVFVFGVAAKLTHGGTRKGVNRVISCFKEAFPSEDNVKLRVKCFPDCPVDKCYDSRVNIIQGYLTKESLRDWYHSLNAYVSISTEGFGLHQLESLACGIPLLGIDYAGVSEFFVGKRIPFKERQYKDKITYDCYGKHAVIEDKDLIEGMREVVNRKREMFLLGAEGRKVSTVFSYENEASSFKHIISNHCL